MVEVIPAAGLEYPHPGAIVKSSIVNIKQQLVFIKILRGAWPRSHPQGWLSPWQNSRQTEGWECQRDVMFSSKLVRSFRESIFANSVVVNPAEGRVRDHSPAVSESLIVHPDKPIVRMLNRVTRESSPGTPALRVTQNSQQGELSCLLDLLNLSPRWKRKKSS